MNLSGPAALWGVKAFEQFFNALGRDLNIRHFRVWAWFKWGIHTGIMSVLQGPLCELLETNWALGTEYRIELSI